jgi:sugar transferase (PEP-CTERM/EpsH1 system associated)
VRILYVAPRFPYPPLRGDQVRAYHQIRLLSRNHSVALVAVADQDVPAEARAHMESLCELVILEPLTAWRAVAGLARVLIGDPRPMQTLLYLEAGRQTVRDLSARGGFDVIHAQLLRTAGLVPPKGRVPLVLDLVDVLSESYTRRMATDRWWWRPALAFEAARLERYEQRLLSSGIRCLVVSEAERKALGAWGESATVNPNGVDLAAFPFTPGRGAPSRIVFVGNLGYPPNIDAVMWFVDEVLPRIRTTVPEAQLVVVGARPSRGVRMSARAPGVILAGTVPNVHAELTGALVAVAPIRAGGGIQNKVLEAMAAGTPVVATSLAVSGVAIRPGEHCLVADTAADFARQVETLLLGEDLRLGLATAARALIEARYSWETSVAELEAVYSKVIRGAQPRARGPAHCGEEKEHEAVEA